GVGRRLAEAARLGFTRAIVPTGSTCTQPGMKITEVSTLAAALTSMGI
ncbi:MAG: DNA repair protein RadA, partial [Rhodococcus sp.]|nr:DNA repair protein RadA [Rhodococcus sp. (in: high G+C Gram-positive bacteria)]